ncbi:MAG: InlB B-repeat-containing protein [Clostridia bacterium]|nr:InlB B-repeat-containing protein [Clostridia bacterium]
MRKLIKKLAVFLVAAVCSVGLFGMLASCDTGNATSSESSGTSGGASSSVDVKYTVIFDADGGTAVADQTVNEGEYASMPTACTKVGYVLDGWYLGDVPFDFSSDKIDSNITLKAKWTVRTDIFYYVEVYVENVDGTYKKLTQTEVASVAPNCKLIRVGTTGAFVDLTAEANAIANGLEGYSVDETQSVLTGTVNGDNSSLFKAYVKRNAYTLSFTDGEGNPVDGAADQTVKFGATVAVASLPKIPEKTDKVAYWTIDGDIKKADFVWTWTEAKTAVAVYYNAPREVAFKVDGEEWKSEVVENGSPVSEPQPAPSKTGYSFVGWYKDNALYDFSAAVTQDLVLNAEFSANEYTLSLDKQEGVGGEDSVQVVYDGTVLNLLPTLTREGYDFVNWTIDGVAVTEETVCSWTEEKTAVANWKIKTYAVEFEFDGAIVEPQTVEHGACAVAPQVSIAGFDVVWKLNGEEFDFTKPVTGAMTLVGAKQLKKVQVVSGSIITGGGTFDLEYGENGEVGAVTQRPCGGTNLIKMLANFNVTAADIEAIEAEGYTHLSFVLAAGGFATSKADVSVMNNYTTVDLENGKPEQVAVPLSAFKEYLAGANVFLNETYIYYQCALTVKDLAFTSLVTVTYEMDGETYATKDVALNGTAEELTESGYDIVWTLDGEAYDFTKPVTGELTLVGTKTLKAVSVNENSAVNGAKIGYADGFGWGWGGLSLDTDIRMGFNITSADIAVFKQLGYTHLSFTFRFDKGWGNVPASINLFGVTVSFANATAVPVNVPLDNLISYTDTAQQWSAVDGVLGKVYVYIDGGNSSIRFNDFQLIQLQEYTVTYMLDGETYATKKVTGNATAENLFVSGYNVVWKLNDEAYDFTKPVTGDITLVGEKSEKVLSLSAASNGKLYGADESTRKTVEFRTNECGFYSFAAGEYFANVGFNLTSEEVEEYKKNYKALTFNVKVYYTNSCTKVTVFGTEYAVASNGGSIAISIPLTDLEAYIDGKTGQVKVGYLTYSGSLVFTEFAIV